MALRECRVFLGYAGESDNTFVDHLCAALKRVQLNILVDREQLQGLEEGGSPDSAYFSRVKGALDSSSVTILLVTAQWFGVPCDFRELGWALEEQNRTKVLPVLWGLSLGEAKLKASAVGDLQWRQLLKDLLTLTVLEKGAMAEPDFVQAVAARALQKLQSYALSSSPRFLKRQSDWDAISAGLGITDLVPDPQQPRRLFGLRGAPGVGKSMLAQRIYNEARLAHLFTGGVSYVQMGHEVNDATIGRLQRQVLEDLSFPEQPWVFQALQQALQIRKYFLVLDDVWPERTEPHRKSQLELLFGPDWQDVLQSGLGRGSCILVVGQTLPSWLDHASHLMQPWPMEPAQHLFGHLAFGGTDVPAEFAVLTKRLLLGCGGLPLAISVVAKLLVAEAARLGRHDPAVWARAATLLDRAREDLARLSVAYDMLPLELKQAFVEVACCWRGQTWAVAQDALWEAGEDLLLALACRGLVARGPGGRVAMHDLLQRLGAHCGDMEGWTLRCGREYVLPHDNSSAITQGCAWPEDCAGVRVLSIYMRAPWHPLRRWWRLPPLRAFPELRCLVIAAPKEPPRTCWQRIGFVLWVALAPLVVLDLILVQPLIWLEIGSYLGGLAGATQLRRLDLAHRTLPLRHLPGSLWTLTELRALRVACRALLGLPADLASLGNLKELDLIGCFVSELPASVGRLTGLQRMRLINCAALSRLPPSMGALTGLQLLDLRGCSCLHNLPAGILALQQSGLRILGRAAARELSQTRSSAHQFFTSATHSPLFRCLLVIFLVLQIVELTRDIQGRPQLFQPNSLTIFYACLFCGLLVCRYVDSSDKCDDDE